MKTLSTIPRCKTKTQRAASTRPRPGFGIVVLALTSILALEGKTVLAQGTSSPASPVIVTDFNRDGIPDLLIHSGSSVTATVALGGPTYGKFESGASIVNFPAVCTSMPQGSIQVGDFNGDGLADIAFACGYTSSTAGVMLSHGDGTFAPPQTFTGANSSMLATGDFDQDGKLDIIVIGPNANTGTGAVASGIQFFHGNGDGTFAASVFTSFKPSDSFSSVAVSDINNDGYPDLVLGDFSATSTLNIFGNNKDKTFGTIAQGVASANVSIAVGTPTGSSDRSILIGNFFGSTGTDLAIPDTGGTPGFFLVKNTSSGTTFSLADAVKVPVAGLVGGMAGRFTGSGFTDLAGANGA